MVSGQSESERRVALQLADRKVERRIRIMRVPTPGEDMFVLEYKPGLGGYVRVNGSSILMHVVGHARAYARV